MFCFIEQANTVIFASSRAHLAAKLSVVILFVSFLFELCKYSQERKKKQNAPHVKFEQHALP